LVSTDQNYRAFAEGATSAIASIQEARKKIEKGVNTVKTLATA
jgi:hypothetical protein